MNKSIIPITEPKPIADCKILNVPISEFNINLGQSRTDKFIYINIEKTNANEIRLIDAGNPKAEPKIAIVRGEDHLYSLEHANDDSFYVRSNLNSPNYKIYKASNIDTLNVSLEEVAPHNPNIFISDHIIFDEYLIASSTLILFALMALVGLRIILFSNLLILSNSASQHTLTILRLEP